MTMRRCPTCCQRIDLAFVVRATIRDRQLSVRDIRFLVAGKVPDVSDKEVANALAYLTRKGMVRRLGYGKYSGVDGETEDRK